MRIYTAILAPLLALACMAPSATWAQAEFQSGHFTTSDGVELHYLEARSEHAESKPLLVFVPGWTMPAWIWQAQLDHFAATHHVVALDPRGQGESEKATYGYTATRQSKDICGLLNHLDDEPAVLVGWSIAGQHVLLCANDVGTEVVSAVVVVDFDMVMEPNRDFAASRIASVQGDRPAFTRDFVEAIHRDPDPEYVEALTEAVLAVPTNAAAMSTANLFFFGPHDMGPILDRRDPPVFLMFSSLDWAEEAAEEARTGWPNLPIEVIDETSHALFVDQPDAFNRMLEAFVTTLPKGE